MHQWAFSTSLPETLNFIDERGLWKNFLDLLISWIKIGKTHTEEWCPQSHSAGSWLRPDPSHRPLDPTLCYTPPPMGSILCSLPSIFREIIQPTFHCAVVKGILFFHPQNRAPERGSYHVLIEEFIETDVSRNMAIEKPWRILQQDQITK